MNCEELNTIDGLQFMPVKSTKVPIVKGWQTFSGKHDLSNCEAVGLVCGKLSGNLEVIDIDLKYDLTGDLFERYKKLVHESDENILKKLVVQKTRSGGYHLIYRCEENSGNLKLANRHTTQDEKKITFNETYKAELKKSKSDDEAKAIAQKSADNDKVRVLFETRGEGGQIVCFPSKGYEIVYGDYYSIGVISKEERDILHGIARQFNEVVQEFVAPKARVEKTKGVSPFEDYNERGDVVGLLENYGWKVVSNKGAKTIFLRPGQTTSQTSGNYDHDKNWFSVFTTSSEFEPEHAYLPYAVFAVLECNKNFSEASKKLYELGYGERYEAVKKPEAQSTRVIKSRVNVDDNDYSFIATPNDYNEHLQSVIDGTLQMGMTTGSPLLDQNFLFKEGELVMANGVDNTGKSVWFWWLLLLSAMYHGWTGIIFSSENTLGAFMRKMIQFYWGKQLRGKYAMTKTEYEIAKAFIEKHFILIKAQEDLFNYKDIINMVKKARKKYPLLKFGMVDPYNSLKIDLSGFSKLSTHEYHYEALSEIKSYGQQTNFGWFITNHAVTSALRAKDGEKKYPLAPRKEDTEGGGKFPNKADCFITVHRITQHPTEWMITEIHVRKIKDTETGGKPTAMDSPIKFEMYKGGCAFVERHDESGQQIDPIEQWHLGNRPNQSKLFDTDIVQQVTKMWMPYADDKDDSPF